MWPFKAKPVRLEVIRKDESKLRLSEWQSDPALCSLAIRILANPDLQLMLSVMRNEHPHRVALRLGCSPDDRVVMQARAEGYEMFFANLEALARHNTVAEIPEAH